MYLIEDVLSEIQEFCGIDENVLRAMSLLGVSIKNWKYVRDNLDWFLFKFVANLDIYLAVELAKTMNATSDDMCMSLCSVMTFFKEEKMRDLLHKKFGFGGKYIFLNNKDGSQRAILNKESQFEFINILSSYAVFYHPKATPLVNVCVRRRKYHLIHSLEILVKCTWVPSTPVTHLLSPGRFVLNI